MGSNITKVTSISSIRRGDHISYKNGWFYHHGIVVDIDVNENILTVIHYMHNTIGSRNENQDNPAISYAKVREEVIDVGLYVTKDKLYRYLYEDHQCVPIEDVVLCARSHKERSKFNVPYNNCEDFAVRCKTIAAGTSSIALTPSEPSTSTLQSKASGFVAGISAGIAADTRGDDKLTSSDEKPL